MVEEFDIITMLDRTIVPREHSGAWVETVTSRSNPFLDGTFREHSSCPLPYIVSTMVLATCGPAHMTCFFLQLHSGELPTIGAVAANRGFDDFGRPRDR